MSKEEHYKNVSTKQDRIAEIAARYPDQALLSLAHHIDLEWLYVAYLRTRKDGATGVDGQSAEEYSADLKTNLTSLLDRFKSGHYRAPAVKRVYIPKGSGKETRPLGIPTFEDKVLQRAVQMALTPVWEKEFYDFSYGFREGRNAHQALKDLREACMKMKGGWIIDLDIRKYFDNIDHKLIREILRKRVCDGVINRILGKWLKAGVLDKGQLSYSEAGTPQGGVISPLLSNIFLHEVFDKWFVETVKPRLNGEAKVFRFADDIIIIVKNERDNRRLMKVLPKRFEKFNLELHPTKTKVADFNKPGRNGDRGKSGTFSFLGFTLYWGKARKGFPIVKWKTETGRLSRAIKNNYLWLKRNRHSKIKDQWIKLKQKLNGHYAYYGLSLNIRSLQSFYWQTRRAWHKWLNRRSQKNKLVWERFEQLLEHYVLPAPHIVHSLWSKT
jgi:RNA-directed DNA polymerase